MLEDIVTDAEVERQPVERRIPRILGVERRVGARNVAPKVFVGDAHADVAIIVEDRRRGASYVRRLRFIQVFVVETEADVMLTRSGEANVGVAAIEAPLRVRDVDLRECLR